MAMFEALEQRALMSAVFAESFDSAYDLDWNLLAVADDGLADSLAREGGELRLTSGGLRMVHQALAADAPFQIRVDWRTEWLFHVGEAFMAMRIDFLNARGENRLRFEARVVSGIDGPEYEFVTVKGDKETVVRGARRIQRNAVRLVRPIHCAARFLQ